MSIKTTGVTSIDDATAEIAVALRDASPGQRDQHYYDEAARLRDEILRGADSRPHLNTAHVRHHSSDDMDGLRELADVFEPVAVVIRPGGSVDVYGYVGVVDQRDHPAADARQIAREALDLINAEPQSFKPAEVRQMLDRLAMTVLGVGSGR